MKFLKKDVVVSIGLQTLFVLMAFVLSLRKEWVVELGGVLRVELHRTGEFFFVVSKVMGFDLDYLFHAGMEELRGYFPDFYWTVYLAGRLIRFGIPLVILSVVVWWVVSGRMRKWAKQISERFSDLNPMTVFISTFFISLVAYFVLRGQTSEPIWFQLEATRSFILLNVVIWALACWVHRERLIEIIRKFLFVRSLPYSLAMTRILYFTYSALLHLAYYFQNHENIGKLNKQPLPGIGWLIEIIPVTPEVYTWFALGGVFVAVMAAIGYRTRLFMVLHAISVFYVFATPNFFGKLWHEQLIIWIGWIMACSPAADVLSVDALLGRSKVQVHPMGYGFHLRTIWLHFGFIYFFAGIYKLWLCGFDWALSSSMINQVQMEWFEHFDTLPIFRIDHFPMVLMVGGLVVILFEMAYIIMLFHDRLRWVSVFGALIMHNTIGTFMYIFFLEMLQLFYLVFIPWNKLWEQMGWVNEKVWTTMKEMPHFVMRPVVLIPLVILGMNGIYGIFRIDSYPFSVYPVYAELIPDTVRYFHYRPLNPDKLMLDFREEGRKVGFRWESYTRIEYAMIREYRQTGTLDTAGVRTMWKRWQLAVPSLAAVDSVEVFIAERLLNPDSSEVHMENRPILSIGTMESTFDR